MKVRAEKVEKTDKNVKHMNISFSDPSGIETEPSASRDFFKNKKNYEIRSIRSNIYVSIGEGQVK